MITGTEKDLEPKGEDEERRSSTPKEKQVAQNGSLGDEQDEYLERNGQGCSVPSKSREGAFRDDGKESKKDALRAIQQRVKELENELVVVAHLRAHVSRELERLRVNEVPDQVEFLDSRGTDENFRVEKMGETDKKWSKAIVKRRRRRRTRNKRGKRKEDRHGDDRTKKSNTGVGDGSDLEVIRAFEKGVQFPSISRPSVVSPTKQQSEIAAAQRKRKDLLERHSQNLNRTLQMAERTRQRRLRRWAGRRIQN